MAIKNSSSKGNIEKRRKLIESTATFGLILICVALIAPFAGTSDLEMLKTFKWIYCAGALIYVVARVVNAMDPSDSLRMRRLRRLEFWAGVAFIAGGAFWFYQEGHLGEYAGVLAVMRDTIMFTLAGALIQIIASWLIVSQAKKESRKTDE